MAWKVDERFVEGLPKQILQVLGVHGPHPAREAGDTSLHVEQVGEGPGPSDRHSGQQVNIYTTFTLGMGH